MNLPEGSSWSSRIFEVMPKLLSTASLPKTNGYWPLSVAVAQLGATQLGGSKVVPATTFAGLLSYTERLSSKFPGWNLVSSSSANAPVAPTALDNKIVTARLLRKTGGQIAKRDPAILIVNSSQGSASSNMQCEATCGDLLWFCYKRKNRMRHCTII